MQAFPFVVKFYFQVELHRCASISSELITATSASLSGVANVEYRSKHTRALSGGTQMRAVS